TGGRGQCVWFPGGAWVAYLCPDGPLSSLALPLVGNSHLTNLTIPCAKGSPREGPWPTGSAVTPFPPPATVLPAPPSSRPRVASPDFPCPGLAPRPTPPARGRRPGPDPKGSFHLRMRA